MARVYCAGPLFNDGERFEMQEIASALEKADHETFLPQRDGFELAKLESHLASLLPPTEAMDVLHQAIFSFDLFKLLSWADAVVANFNGRVPDEGTIVEAALAWHAGRPVVVFKNDSRAPFDGLDNPMLTGLSRGAHVARLADLAGILDRHLAETKTNRAETVVAAGRTLGTIRMRTKDPQAISSYLMDWARRNRR